MIPRFFGCCSLKVLFLLLCPGLLPAFAARTNNSFLTESKELYFAQLADGGGYATGLILVNPENTNIDALLELFQSDGTPLMLTLNGVRNSVFRIPLNAHGTVFLQSEGTGAAVRTGWARVQSTMQIGGSLIYSYSAGGRVQSEAGLDPSPQHGGFLFSVDTRGSYLSGLAVVNPGVGTVFLTYWLYDTEGRQLGKSSGSLAPMRHSARLIEEIFPGLVPPDFAGSVLVETAGAAGVVATTLRFDIILNSLASIPVIPLLPRITSTTIPGSSTISTTSTTTSTVPVSTTVTSTVRLTTTTTVVTTSSTVRLTTTTTTAITTTTTTMPVTTSSTSSTTSTLHPGMTAGMLITTDPVVGNLRFAPAGTFLQGLPDTESCRYSGEGRQFVHTLTRSIAVMETEVTRQMWANLRAAKPSLPADPTNIGYAPEMSYPVQSLSKNECFLFANLLSLQQGVIRAYYKDSAFTIPLEGSNYSSPPVFCMFDAGGYRLPTEGEWEYFARAGTTGTSFLPEPAYLISSCQSCTPGTFSVLEGLGWFCANSGPTPHPVGIKAANPWGLKDIYGNLWEMCWDWGGLYPTSAQIDYSGPPAGLNTVLRGGSFDSYPAQLRSGARISDDPDKRSGDAGFRLVRTIR